MANCLITQLKSVVQNDNLKKLGSLHFSIKEMDNPSKYDRAVYIASVKECKVITTGGYVSLTYEGLANQQTEVTIPANTDTTVFFSNGNFKAEITEKYSIYKIQYVNNVGPIGYLNLNDTCYSPLNTLVIPGVDVGDSKLSSIKDVTSLVLLNIKGSNISGDIASLANLENLENLNLAASYDNPPISGNINSLGNLTKITSIDFYRIHIEGTIEEFVSAQYGNGRYTCAGIAVPTLLSFVSFGGNHSTTYYQHITWESNTKMAVALGGSNVSNSPTIWTKGYTLAEAQAAFPNASNYVSVDNVY